MSGRTNLTAVEPADCGTGANGTKDPGSPCRRFNGNSNHEGTCVELLYRVVCKYGCNKKWKLDSKDYPEKNIRLHHPAF
jgi:hypothetical protein